MADISVLDLIRIAVIIVALFFWLRLHQCVNGTRAQYLAASWFITFSGLTLALTAQGVFLFIKDGDNVNVAFGSLAIIIWTYYTTLIYLKYDNWYKDSFTKLKKGFMRLQEQWLPRPAAA